MSAIEGFHCNWIADNLVMHVHYTCTTPFMYMLVHPLTPPPPSSYDSDNPLAEGDVGMAGVAVDSVEDMKVYTRWGTGQVLGEALNMAPASYYFISSLKPSN